jgi:sec-independent protein translocase protein TatC
MWSFIAPGLYDHEKQGIHRAFFFGCVMFYLGVAVGYFVVFPLALRFLATYSLSSNITPMISLNSYMDNFYMLILLMGAVFELPLLSWLLGKIGVITRKFFSKYRRHAIVALLITAGLITPTGDPFTLMVVFIPIYALWEFSAILVPKSAVGSAGQ